MCCYPNAYLVLSLKVMAQEPCGTCTCMVHIHTILYMRYVYCTLHVLCIVGQYMNIMHMYI